MGVRNAAQMKTSRMVERFYRISGRHESNGFGMKPDMRPTLRELRRLYVEEARPLPKEVEAALREDGRAGARAILQAVERRRRENRAEGQRLRHMLTFENELWAEGIAEVAGVDEAGMSPLAGPVYAAAVILPRGAHLHLRGVDDSKKLDASTREELARRIRDQALAYCVARAEVEEIDRLNIYRAGLLAMKRAIEGLMEAGEESASAGREADASEAQVEASSEPSPNVVVAARKLPRPPGALLIDARRIPELPLRQIPLVKGDQRSLSIAAASILAKTARDAHMVELDALHPGYGFARHKGYPAPEHYKALETLGPCPAHRRSFAPVRKALGLEPEQAELPLDE